MFDGQLHKSKHKTEVKMTGLQAPIFKGVLLRGLYYRCKVAQLHASSLIVGDRLLLEREPDNPHDSSAVKVLPFEPIGCGSDCFLGYISKEIAAYVSVWIDSGWAYQAIFSGFYGQYPVLDLYPLHSPGLYETTDISQPVSA